MKRVPSSNKECDGTLVRAVHNKQQGKRINIEVTHLVMILHVMSHQCHIKHNTTAHARNSVWARQQTNTCRHAKLEAGRGICKHADGMSLVCRQLLKSLTFTIWRRLCNSETKGTLLGQMKVLEHNYEMAAILQSAIWAEILSFYSYNSSPWALQMCFRELVEVSLCALWDEYQITPWKCY